MLNLAPTDTIMVYDDIPGYTLSVELHEVLSFRRTEVIVQTRETNMDPDGGDAVIETDDNTRTIERTWYLTMRNGGREYMVDDKDIEEQLDDLAYDSL